MAAVLLESVSSFRLRFGETLRTLEWIFTGLFTIEYALRILCVHEPRKYIFSFYGIVDLLAILPSYFSLFFPGAQSLLVVRGLRLFRVFRVFKLARFVDEGNTLLAAIRASRAKVTVFLEAVLILVLVMGSLMYLIEGEANGFTSIPKSIYWAIVTMTTVGYGDIAPQTVVGQVLASIIMIAGYAIIAVPTGIVSVELANATKLTLNTRCCPGCTREGHELEASYCRFCGEKL